MITQHQFDPFTEFCRRCGSSREEIEAEQKDCAGKPIAYREFLVQMRGRVFGFLHVPIANQKVS